MNINWTDVKTFFINQNEVTKIQLNGTTLWQKSSGPTPPTPGPDYTEPFYIEDISNTSFDISFIKNNVNAPTLLIEYSTDKTNWSVLGSTSTTALSVQVPANSKMYFRCNTNIWGTRFYCNKIISNGTFFSVGGNIMSLLYGSNFTGQETTFPIGEMYVFNNLFNSSYYLNNASDLILPATTLTNYCYNSMFNGCSSLTQAPVTLPATTLAGNCYNNMFCKCTSLTTAPVLPATTLAEYCYYQMFVGCTNLATAPELPATTLKRNCYYSMFEGCTNLATAPELPATTLAERCYYYMFYRCSSLNYVKCLATDISASNCTSNWLNVVSATGTFVKDASMNHWTTGSSGIPSGWTVQDAS